MDSFETSRTVRLLLGIAFSLCSPMPVSIFEHGAHSSQKGVLNGAPKAFVAGAVRGSFVSQLATLGSVARIPGLKSETLIGTLRFVACRRSMSLADCRRCRLGAAFFLIG